ncbi:thioredoxin family protein [Colletotrichum incanum]|uniref:Thioredoxin n=1 Tax=Colletotrichum incanum TaxID=1573173 RepID=A0A167BZP6_COLIC|nr:thioredoxin family protein [Colletotrichum incanum]OHX00937.1 thioredoxin-like protein [Colletotrichum incanum]
MAITTIESVDDFIKLQKSNSHVIVDFHAVWCAPCKAMAPFFQMHADELAPRGVAFAKVDVDVVPELAAQYRVTTIPTFFFIKDGQPIDEVRSATPNKLKEAFARLQLQ